MSGLNYLKLSSTLSNICNTTQLDDATKCHHAFKNFWGEPWFENGSCWVKNEVTRSNVRKNLVYALEDIFSVRQS